MAWLILTLKRQKLSLKILEVSLNLILVCTKFGLPLCWRAQCNIFYIKDTSNDAALDYLFGSSRVHLTLKKEKSPGEDRISTNMLIHLPQNFILFIVILINCSITLNIFVDCWKMAIIVPLPKSGADDIHTPSRFRPISLLSSLSKIYEYVLVNRLKAFFNSRLAYTGAIRFSSASFNKTSVVKNYWTPLRRN